jgi:hypothetical protein
MKGAARNRATFFTVFAFSTASVRIVLVALMIFSLKVCDSVASTYAWRVPGFESHKKSLFFKELT